MKKRYILLTLSTFLILIVVTKIKVDINESPNTSEHIHNDNLDVSHQHDKGKSNVLKPKLRSKVIKGIKKNLHTKHEGDRHHHSHHHIEEITHKITQREKELFESTKRKVLNRNKIMKIESLQYLRRLPYSKESVVIVHTKSTLGVHKFNALVSEVSGDILKTWNRSRPENFRGNESIELKLLK